MKPKDEDQEDLKLRLARIAKQSCNRTCADCPEKRPAWVSSIKPQQNFALGSTTLASFVCLECAGLHRKLGTHICFVRSVNLDEWAIDDVDAAEYTGNEVVNEIFEGHIQKSLSNSPGAADAVNIKPLQGAHVATRERFIRQKYVDLYFYSKSSHYRHISDATAKRKANIRLKPPQSPGKAARKKLSNFIKSGNSEKEFLKGSKSASGCSTTVGNTASTSRTDATKSVHSMPIKRTTRSSFEAGSFLSNGTTPINSDNDNTFDNNNNMFNNSFTSREDNSTKKRTLPLSDPSRKKSPHSTTSRIYSQRRSSSRGRCRSKLRDSSDIDDGNNNNNNNNNEQQRNRSTSRVRTENSNKSRGRRGRSRAAHKKDQDNITTGVVGTPTSTIIRDRSSSRIRSSSKKPSGKTLDIREKGRNSASLHRSRSKNPRGDPLGRSNLSRGRARKDGIYHATLIPDEENQPQSSKDCGTENQVPTSKNGVLSGMILVFDDEDTVTLESNSEDVPMRRNRQRRGGSRRPRGKSTGRANASYSANLSMESLNNEDLDGHNKSRVRSKSEIHGKGRHSSSDLLKTPVRDVSRSKKRGELASPVSRGRGSSRSLNMSSSRSLNMSSSRSLNMSNNNIAISPNNDRKRSSSARKWNTKLPLEEDSPQKTTSEVHPTERDRSRNMSRSRSTRKLNINAPLVDSHSLPKNMHPPSKIKSNNTEADEVTVEPLKDCTSRSSRHDDPKQNADNSGEGDFQVVAHTSFNHSSFNHSKGNKSSDFLWDTNVSFSRPYVNKKGADAMAKNRRRSNREAMEINGTQRQYRKNDIFASLNRVDLEDNDANTHKEKGSSTMRKTPQRTKSNDIGGGRKHTTTIQRSTPGRSKSGVVDTKFKQTSSVASGEKNKVLMDEWEKMKNGNNMRFSDFGNSFSKFG
jgi:stromal membrane-associated protein